jgi:exodeoxyribonuclease V alpha subunit
MELENLLQRLTVRPLDRQFALFIQDLYPQYPDLSVAALLVSHELGKGNVCLDFSLPHECLTDVELQTLLKQLKNTVSDIDCPLVLEEYRLYLQKYYQYETQLADDISFRLNQTDRDLTAYKGFIAQLFPNAGSGDSGNGEIDWQAVAACVSAKKGFSVISGGPGTGKTTTVIRLLALLVKVYQTEMGRAPIIKLAAPTGKAAMRLTESIIQAKQGLDVDDSILSSIPQSAETLHRLLKPSRNGGFVFNQHNPLHLDVLIVDEASMVDLPMMAKLVSALPKHGQLVLLGDKDQLASVEAGSVLADICDNEVMHGFSQSQTSELAGLLDTEFNEEHIERTGAVVRDGLCQLRKSYRFDESSGIGHLAKASNAGDYLAWHNTLSEDRADIQAMPLSDDSYQTFIKQAACDYQSYFNLIQDQGMNDDQAREVHKQFSCYQVLCALKDGPLGVSGLNEAIEKRLLSGKGPQTWYAGRPVIILENDYGLNLYNGDIGIVLPHMSDSGKVILKATFVGNEGQIRWLQPSRLPKHETVYAMTIHKSQGSEFDHCALVLPDHSAPILSKELIYTGVTRAKQRLTLLYQETMVKQALSQKVQRASGLGHRLWKQSINVGTEPRVTESNHEQHADETSGSSSGEQFSLFQ